MRLIACDTAMAVRPLGPMAGEVFEKQFSQGFAIVADDALVGLGALLVFLIEHMSEGPEIVTTTLLELFVHLRSPIGSVNLVGVVEHGMGERCLIIREYRVETG